uniref:Cadherin domain-containing protein n=1 Tax=Monodelphis domestica TaxID=13616 RepID=F6SWX7_MONDO
VKRARQLWSQALFLFLGSLFCRALSEHINYSIPEEMAKGSVVGNIAKDLGLEIRDLPTRKLRVSAEREYFSVSEESGDLLVSDRVDREEICGRKLVCALEFEMVAENPLNFYRITVVIEDINDNPPRFSRNIIDLEISEIALPGVTFTLESPQDPDVGVNSLQQYFLSLDPHFSLLPKENPDGSKYAELVLEKPLDREKQSSYSLILTAVDSGIPVRSGTVEIRINVTDANDNWPVFSQEIYRVILQESLPPGSSVLQVTATDQDEGNNAEITYSLSTVETLKHLFKLDSRSGELTTKGILDFEKGEGYTLGVEAKDGGGHTAFCKIQIEILDENDNAPEVTFASVSNHIPENSMPGTVVALIKTVDPDSGINGEIFCRVKDNIPFKISSSTNNLYKLVTDGALDREEIPEYNITIIATDKGNPPLTTSKILTLHITDVNDNPPVFLQSSYVVYVPENNPSGTSIACVSATDLDLEENGRVSYSIVSSDLEPLQLFSYVSVNSHSGHIFAQSSFDYEQVHTFELTIQARDAGFPSLNANVTMQVFIVDSNDNAPNILYPALGPDRSALFDMVPRSAKPGYLVTKVVAVDADSGHNAWLAYRVLQATDQGLFSLGLRTGEVKTVRALAERDVSRHRLLVSVQDEGQPPLSATVLLHLVFADSLQEALPEMKEDLPPAPESQSELQFYLVVALALISVLFLITITLAIALQLRRSSNPSNLSCFRVDLCSKTGSNVPTNYSEGTLPYSYNLCAASEVGKMEYNFLKLTGEMAPLQDLLSNDPSLILSTSDENKKIISDLVISSHVSFLIHFYFNVNISR